MNVFLVFVSSGISRIHSKEKAPVLQYRQSTGAPRISQVCHYNFADNSLPALNLATFLALILMTAPVSGFRPLRAALLDTEKVPNPTSVTFPPPFKVLVTASTKESREAFA